MCRNFFELKTRARRGFHFLCGRRDSNPHASRRQILSLVCLPISPRPQQGGKCTTKNSKTPDVKKKLFILHNMSYVTTHLFKYYLCAHAVLTGANSGP